MRQRFAFEPMDAEGRTVTLVPPPGGYRVAVSGMTIADFEASEETLRQRLEKLAAVAEVPASRGPGDD